MDILDLNEVTVSEGTLNSDLDRLVKLVKHNWKLYQINIEVILVQNFIWFQYKPSMPKPKDIHSAIVIDNLAKGQQSIAGEART